MSGADAPALHRRVACLLYEGTLLFGVAFVTSLIYGVLTRQVHALNGRAGLILALCLVLAAYFSFQWHRAGQTLPMRTWRIRVIDAQGHPPSLRRALARFAVAALALFLPALALPWAMGLSHQSVLGSLAVGSAYVLGYVGSSRLLPGGQYLHDALCGTRLVNAPVIRGAANPPA